MNYLVPRRCRALLRSLTVFITLLAIGLVPTASAAEAGTGTIEGRVFNTATGMYLSKARVVVAGSNLEALTNDFGEYRITDVPAGTAQLRVTYTGQQAKTTSVTVPADGVVTQNLEFSPDSAVQLDEYVVKAERFNTAHELAVNEERYSVNIKNVVSSDAFGHIPDGNLGEFIKFMPGILVTYGGTNTNESEASGISIRGFGPEHTMITIDGMPVSNPTTASLTNQIGLNMLTVTNASRIEVVKVPTPDMPNDAVGGIVNLVSRSAFEFARPTYSGRVYLALNTDNLDIFSKSPGPANKETYKTLPGADFSVSYPVSKTFGFSLSLFTSNQIGENQRVQPRWRNTSLNFDRRPIGGPNGPVTNTSGISDLDNPYMDRASITDSPRSTFRHSASAKIDWKPTPNQLISATLQSSMYESINVDRRLQYTIAAPADWGSDFVNGLAYVSAANSQTNTQMSPAHALEMTVTARDTEGKTNSGGLRYELNKDGWLLKANGSLSRSRSGLRDTNNGHLSSIDLRFVPNTIGDIDFNNIADGIPNSIVVRDRAGATLDTTQLGAWQVNGDLRARTGDSDSRSEIHTYTLDLRRDLSFFEWGRNFAVQVGFREDSKLDEKFGGGSNQQYQYVGTTPVPITDLLDTSYIETPGFSHPKQQWVDLYRLYDYFNANPQLFDKNHSSVRVDNYNNFVNQQKYLRITKRAWYAMFDGALLRNNRLKFVAGARQSEDSRKGRGPFTDNQWNFIRNPDGSRYRDSVFPQGVTFNAANSALFATNQQGQDLRARLTAAGISFPTAPSLDPLTNRMLQLKPNVPISQKVRNDPTWSANFSYDFTDRLVAKLAWSRTLKQPSLENSNVGLLSGNNAYTFNEAGTPSDSLGGQGTLTIANPGLLPELSNNWDLTVGYYNDKGGKFTVGYFMKKIENMHQNLDTFNNDPSYASILDAAGLSADTYDNITVRSAFNGIGTATNDGWEFDFSQKLGALRFFGDWGRSFTVSASYSMKKLKQNLAPGTVALANTSDNFGSAALFFNRGRINANIRATFREDTAPSNPNQNVAYDSDGDGTTETWALYDHNPAEWRFDADVNYQLTRRFSLFASGRDIFSSERETRRYDGFNVIPTYAQRTDFRRFGVTITVGVQGSF